MAMMIATGLLLILARFMLYKDKGNVSVKKQGGEREGEVGAIQIFANFILANMVLGKSPSGCVSWDIVTP